MGGVIDENTQPFDGLGQMGHADSASSRVTFNLEHFLGSVDPVKHPERKSMLYKRSTHAGNCSSGENQMFRLVQP
ncbi:hypothetical protein GCM10007392_26650 [Saccharospirillum salsuginis]|uniref:Uncharacterized protein n=1 Tax=Saccharospirillum salsuginis TaxID=418750 RepID=A0A918NA41_9GAMM|nr:hypothetical protein GCM10007392_26650 [Saccharospirillum salsuginis]